jgi:hypothetical protein
LTDREQRDVTSGGADEVTLRRVLIILTVKSAYIKAIQQPPGFDYRRMECSLPNETFKVDGTELSGWEIRLFKANLGIQRKEVLVEEVYQCCAMIYRGGQGNRVFWNDREGEATEMLNFLKVDQIVKAYDGLAVKNGAPSNNVNGRARVNGSSTTPSVSHTAHAASRRMTGEQARRSSEDSRMQTSVTH